MFEIIDMNNYKPYKKMGKTIITRTIENKKVVWPNFEEINFNGNFKIRIIDKKDIFAVTQLWRENYGELYGSSSKYDWVLYPERYDSNVALRESWEKDRLDKSFCMVIFEEKESLKIIGANVWFKDDRNLQIESSLGTFHHEYRQGKNSMDILSLAGDFIKKIENESGAEYLTAFCETWHSITQFLCFKRWGYKVAGIFPGQFTRWNGEQQEYRACEVHFYKFIGDAEKYVTKIGEIKLFHEFNELWNTLENINKSSTERF